MMLEIIIFCVIFLAVSYWAVLWLMGRREDVLHGEFTEGKLRAREPVRPVFPVQPAEPAVVAEPVPAQAAVPEPVAFKSEQLDSLLNSIKQDLSHIVQK